MCVWCRLLHVGCALGCVWLWDRVIRRFWWVGVVWGCIVVGAVRVVACGCVWLCVPAPARGLRAGVCVASVWVRVCVCVCAQQLLLFVTEFRYSVCRPYG